jgi:hypothetical protein
MKTNFRFFLLIAIFSSLLFSACEPVDTTAPGSDARDAFVGYWQFIESSSYKSTDGQNFIVSISKDPVNSTQVLLKNFGNPGYPNASVTGIVTASQIVIASQSMSNGWIVEGSGKTTNVAKTAMSWTYSITAGGDKVDYTAVSTLQ